MKSKIKTDWREVPVISIDVNKIPYFREERLCVGAYLLTLAVFQQPGEEERYQRWLAERYPERVQNERSIT